MPVPEDPRVGWWPVGGLPPLRDLRSQVVLAEAARLPERV